ncbi:MAG: phage holin family protein [Castellaniella sp.]|uniref:phage holin family protein n=1 Tax=Castellaniella sp. TaxID=1955812 RepID=UPI002A35D78F|nr:phage holin family protein [Castellaniella sp.]MDY0308870.1 phage holin family protein [Castellaniella sp.]
MGPIGRAFSSLAAQLAALAGTRLELFSLEARDAGERLLCRLAALLAAAVFLLLALLVATLALALVFWPTEYRFLALGLLALVYAALGVGLVGWLAWRLKRDPDPFAVTVEVLREDEAGLRAVLAGVPEPDASEQSAGRAVDAGIGGD